MKKHIKKLLTCTLALLMAFILAGCQSTPDQTPSEQSITIEHLKGTAVINGEVKKVAVFDFGFLDTMKVMGIETELALPISSLPDYLSEFKDAVNAGGIKEPDLEALYTFKPDVIIISGRQSDYYEELNKIAPTIYVEVNAETYLEDVKKNTEIAAKIFNADDAADKAIQALETQVEEAKKTVGSTDQKALILLTNDGTISAYGAGSRFGLIHDLLGIPTADSTITVSTHGQSVNYEYIAKINPDILYVVDRTQVVGGTTTTNTTLDNDLVKQTNAYQHQQIINLTPDYWYLSSGGLLSVSEMIKEAVAPFK